MVDVKKNLKKAVKTNSTRKMTSNVVKRHTGLPAPGRPTNLERENNEFTMRSKEEFKDFKKKYGKKS